MRSGIDDVLERRELRQQVVELEDEAERPVAELAAAGLGQREHVLAGDRERSPASGRSSVPSTWSSVDFPTPDAPTIASISPVVHVEVEALEHAARTPAAVR